MNKEKDKLAKKRRTYKNKYEVKKERSNFINFIYILEKILKMEFFLFFPIFLFDEESDVVRIV